MGEDVIVTQRWLEIGQSPHYRGCVLSRRSQDRVRLEAIADLIEEYQVCNSPKPVSGAGVVLNLACIEVATGHFTRVPNHSRKRREPRQRTVSERANRQERVEPLVIGCWDLEHNISYPCGESRCPDRT
jgi:hypothetical protein